MKLRKRIGILFFILLLILSGCQQSLDYERPSHKVKIGIMIVDYGLGDQSFNDTALQGLLKAREELGVIFDYRDLNLSESYEQGLKELIEDEKSDLVIGLGFNMVEAFTNIAKAYPNQQFLFIDQKIDLPNVSSVTFKEDEGSFLVGIIAGLKTSTESIGFIGGMDMPVIERIRDGFIAGAKAVNPTIHIMSEYAGDFGNPDAGKKIAKKMIEDFNVDHIYQAAGFTGLGAIEEAAKHGIYAIGVDSDQFHVAEKTIITSMLKNIDVAVYKAVKEFVENGAIKESGMLLGIKEDGVGIAPIRIITLSKQESLIYESLKEKLLNNSISIHPIDQTE